MSVKTLLAERDGYPPQSPEWTICNRTAWRLHLFETGGLLSDTAPPPADFGPHSLNPEMMMAAE